MIRAVLLAALAGQSGKAADPDLWQECQIETATICGPGGCKSVEPTLKLYLGDYVGDYVGDNGKRTDYYYRCRGGAECDIVENPSRGSCWAADRPRIQRVVPQKHKTRIGAAASASRFRGARAGSFH